MSETIGDVLKAMREAADHNEFLAQPGYWADRLEAAIKSAPERVRDDARDRDLQPGAAWQFAFRAELGLDG